VGPRAPCDPAPRRGQPTRASPASATPQPRPHDRGQPHVQACVARTQRVERLPPPLPNGAHAPGRRRPLFVFPEPPAAQIFLARRTDFSPDAQFSRPRPRRDLVATSSCSRPSTPLRSTSSHRAAPWSIPTRRATAVVNFRSPTSLHPALIAIVEVSSPRPLSLSPFSLSHRMRSLRPCSPSSRHSSSPARPRPAAAQLRGQQALRAAASLSSRLAARSEPGAWRASLARPRLVPARNGRVATRSLHAQLAPVPPVAGALRVRPNPTQNSRVAALAALAARPAPPPWLARVTESPSPTPPTSLQPAPAVRLPSPCLELTVSRVAHVKSRVRSASPCSRSRHRATGARACVRLRAVRRRDPVYP
jgi:hypothetical protein